MIETFKIETDKGPIQVSWSDIELMTQYASFQNGGWGQGNFTDNVELYKKFFSIWHTKLWNIRKEMSVFDIPEGSKILDIGCGLAVVDLLLYSYVKDSKIYLLDKEEQFNINDHDYFTVTYSASHPFYHSWKPVNDAIKTSNFDRNRFILLEPEDAFPEDLDLILSSFSWCWHYPKEHYWEKVFNSLKKGGKLYLDVKSLPDRDMVQEISESLKSKPVRINIPNPNSRLMDQGTGDHCLWVKNI